MANIHRCDYCGKLIESLGELRGVNYINPIANLNIREDLCKWCFEWLMNRIKERKENFGGKQITPDWPDNILPFRGYDPAGPTVDTTDGAPRPTKL